MSRKRCRVQKYDPAVTEPPYTFIELDSFEVIEPDVDTLGEELYERLAGGCRMLGYRMKFYSLSTSDYDYEEYDYDVTVE